MLIIIIIIHALLPNTDVLHHESIPNFFPDYALNVAL